MKSGLDELVEIYESISGAQYCKPWDQEPYAILRREKGGKNKTNEAPHHKAKRLASWLDFECGKLARLAAQRSDNLYREE